MPFNFSDKMTKIRVGCSGWSYKGWIGPFYPDGTKAGDYLRLYAKVFDTVEVDSTFYGTPSPETVKNWADSTPDDFLFTVKLPRTITHERKLKGTALQLGMFVESVSNLGRKLGHILVQLPPSMKYGESEEPFRSFLKTLPENVSFAFEFRHMSWFREEVYDELRKKGVTLAWADIPYTQQPPVLTSSSLYLRLVGDRSIPEEAFGTVQKDRTSGIREWAMRIRKIMDDVNDAVVFSNNHFQGFSPATVNLFREEIGLEKVKWKEELEKEGRGSQKSLFDW